jgi:hypothetical protein
MRSTVAALVAAGACLILAGPATADVRHATLGDVSATLTYTQHAGVESGLRLRVTRAGALVYSNPITTASGRPGALHQRPRVRQFLGAQLRVLDLNGDGTGEAVVDLAERGAYCCSHTVIAGTTAVGGWRAVELDWGSFGSAAEAEPIKDGYLLVGRDARLEERFTPHVLSFEPVQVWRWDDGIVQDVSKQQPLVVQGDLSHLLAEQRTLLRRPDHATLDLRGLATAIAGDQLLLGQVSEATQTLQADVAAGRLRVSSGSGPTGTAFPPALLALLGRLGY